jgi:hypothetical protein
VSNPLPEAYPTAAAAQAWLAGADEKQPGDVVKGSRVIVEVLTGTGAGAGREIPLRLVLGADCVAGIREKMASIEALLQAWEPVAFSTDHDDVKKAAA